MEPQSPMNTIRHLRLDFYGCAYRTTLDAQIRSDLSQDGIDPVIRGQTAPAAGASLSVDIVISFMTSIASGFAVEAIKAVMSKVGKATNKVLSSDCHLGRTTIETDACDFVIMANSSAGVYAEDIDYNALVSQMKYFYEKEVAAGRAVDSIEAPCDLDLDTDGLKIRAVGVGNFSLWRVTYRNGSRWPFCLYDAINDALVPMEDRQTITNVINGTDKFYSPK